ncbi:MAG: 3-oxoacyl-ACP reductase family protein [Bacillota bacterium]
MRLQRKTALITGASKGIGMSVARAFAHEGASLILVSRNINKQDEIVRELEKEGIKFIFRRVDVGERAQVRNLVNDALSIFGKIDVLFNNAGISRPAMLWKMTPEIWNEVIKVNLNGVFYCLQAVAETMMVQQGGSIINVTSSEALLGTFGQINYAAAKGAVHALTKSAAKELARYNIRVNSIAPMAMTEMTKVIFQDNRFQDKYRQRIAMNRFAQPEEIAPAVLFLASDESSYITGQTICVDGGMVMR